MTAHDITSTPFVDPRRIELRSVFLVGYFLSGVVALAYQVLWARLLSLQFGVSIFGITVTAAAFMLGLGIGSLLGATWGVRLRRSLPLFAAIEFAIALFALVLPMVQAPVQMATDSIAQNGSVMQWYAVQGVTTLLVLAVPTTAMGFGFALVVSAARARGVSLASIYGCNAAGGAVGALLPLVTLPVLGWGTSNIMIALLGVVVSMLFGWLAWQLREPIESEVSGIQPAPVVASKIPLPIWIGYAGIGFAALLLEVSWIRLYGMILLRTEYVVAIILSVFLVGIGLGSLLARWRPIKLARAWFPLLVPLLALLSLWALEPVSQWVHGGDYLSFSDWMAAQVILLMVITLPTTMLLGAWYPILVAHSGEAGPREAAGLYGVNCLGGVLGAIALPLLLAWMGTTACIVVSAIVFLICGAMLMPQRGLWLGVPLMAWAAWSLWTLPPAHRVMAATLADTRDLFVHEDALAITHVVARSSGERLLLSDLQRMDASTEPSAVVSQMNQLRLPLLLHSDAKSVLLLGLGTGISAVPTQALPGLEVTAVELAQGAIAAAREFFAPLNREALAKMTLVHDDARRFLQHGDVRYDVIVGDLFHPDLVGRSTLLTVQQFQRVRSRLKEDGLFVQWLALNQFDIPSLEAVIRAFVSAFPASSLYVDGFRLALVSRGPDAAQTVLDGLARLSAAQQTLLTGGEGGWTWLGRYWSAAAVVSDGPAQDEWWPRIEFSLPRSKYNGQINLPNVIAWLLSRRASLQQARAAFAVHPDQMEEFERAYISNELALRSWQANLTGHPEEAQRLLRLAYEGNPSNRWVTSQLADQMWRTLDEVVARGKDRDQALEQIIQMDPDYLPALRAQRQRARDTGQVERERLLDRRIMQVDPFAATEPQM